MMVPLTGLDQLNEPTWLSKQGEEMPRQARQSRLRKASGPSTIQITAMQNDATWDPTPDGPPDPFLVVNMYSVKPGTVADFLALTKEVSEVVKKMGKAKAIYVHRVAFGGDGYEFHVATGYAALGDITAHAEFRKAMGDAAYTAYVQKQASIINSVHREIVRYRPEFSYVPSK
jgi:hypothetical protein